MKKHLIATLGSGALLLASCGNGGSGGSVGGGGATGGGGSPTPAPTSSVCSLDARQNWVQTQLQEWYLFPSLLANGVARDAHGTVQSYIDALVAPAREQSRDRNFTYITSIEEENAYYTTGSNAAFGVRLIYDDAARRVHVAESFEGSPASGANLDRGAEILAIGTNANDLQSVASLMASGGSLAVSAAFGPSEPGVTRVLRITDSSGITREVSLSKAEFALDPVSDRYGAKIINDGGRQVGYLNLRTFINPAEDDLIQAFADFRSAGIDELIIDFRYNGGGLLSIAALFGDLLGAGRGGEVFSQVSYRESKSAENSTSRFMPLAQSIAPSRIAFIGSEGTASASEMVINGMIPYLGTDMALIGENTYGKPVGQIAIDRPQCDDRLRVVAFQLENANGQGEYFDGLADTVPASCRASDDLDHQMGDPREEMTARALDFLAGRSCTPIGGGAITVQRAMQRELLRPQLGGTAEREVPGLF